VAVRCLVLQTTRIVLLHGHSRVLGRRGYRTASIFRARTKVEVVRLSCWRQKYPPPSSPKRKPRCRVGRHVHGKRDVAQIHRRCVTGLDLVAIGVRGQEQQAVSRREQSTAADQRWWHGFTVRRA
jgi:hypothetical protein